MANEISRTTRLSWTRNGAQIISNVTETADQEGEQAIQNVQIIGGTSEAVNLGDVTTPKYIMFKNANQSFADAGGADDSGYATKALYDAAHRVYIGTTDPVTTVAGVAEFVLIPQQGVSIVTDQSAWFAIRGSISVNLLVTAIEG